MLTKMQMVLAVCGIAIAAVGVVVAAFQFWQPKALQ